MSSLPSNLQSAVDSFREQVLNHNVATISYLVSSLESEAALEADRYNRTETEVQAAVLRSLTRQYLRRDLPLDSSISRARDLLEADDQLLLAEHFQLDGVSRGNIDVQKRQHWLELLGNELARLREESDRGEGQWPETLPSELQTLVINVHGIMRPGLPYDRVRSGTDFYDCLIEYESKPSDMKKRVFIPSGNDELTMVWPGWDVAVAVRLGKGDMNPSVALALFCKDEYEPSREWAWRFGVCDEEWSSELFDDLVTFLNWFATYEVQTEDDIQSEMVVVDWGRGLQGAMFG